jgi:propanol-preferring alcohol dehydrogenase
MKAMVLTQLCAIAENRNPLEPVDIAAPVPGDNEILIKVSTCGVCHTELDEIEGRTPPPQLPIILGHQVVGQVEKTGARALKFRVGDRVGVAWIHHSACGQCSFCRRGTENLCPRFKATGRDVHGGYAEFTTVPEDFAHHIPDAFNDLQAAPLLCAGAIGYRSMRLSGIEDNQNLGLTGFGASAHLVLQMVRYQYPKTKVFVFARSEKERNFARQLGASWAGDTDTTSPEKLHSVIDTTPVWKPIVEALACLKPGGRLIVNAIRKEESDKADVREFLKLAAEMQIQPQVQEFDLKDANRALVELKDGKIRGAKVLKIN